MKLRRSVCFIVPGMAIAGLILGSSLNRPLAVRAAEPEVGDTGKTLSMIGLAIAPVPLNLQGKNRDQVGLGSYIVNAQADCNSCHTADPSTEYASGGNPYYGQRPTVINPATYLSGGEDFGALVDGSAEIVSRNLTPDRTGRPAGGRTYSQFVDIMRHGIDYDHLHPTCSGEVNVNCIPAPYDGDLLQIMNWPAFSHMTDADITAIYQYLSAIPCIAGPAAPSILHNDCK